MDLCAEHRYSLLRRTGDSRRCGNYNGFSAGIPDRCTRADPDRYGNRHSDGNVDQHCNQYANRDRDSDGNRHSGAHLNTNGHGNSNSDCNGKSNDASDRHSDGNRNSHPNGNGHADGDSFTLGHCIPNNSRVANEHLYGDRHRYSNGDERAVWVGDANAERVSNAISDTIRNGDRIFSGAVWFNRDSHGCGSQFGNSD